MMLNKGETKKCMDIYQCFMEFYDTLLKQEKENTPPLKPGQEVSAIHGGHATATLVST